MALNSAAFQESAPPSPNKFDNTVFPSPAYLSGTSKSVSPSDKTCSIFKAEVIAASKAVPTAATIAPFAPFCLFILVAIFSLIPVKFAGGSKILEKLVEVSIRFSVILSSNRVSYGSSAFSKISSVKIGNL